MAQVQFAAQSYQSRSLPLDGQRCINMFVEMSPPDAKTHAPVFGCSGLIQFATVGGGPIRGMIVVNDILYVVSGSALYSVDLNGTPTLLSGATPIDETNVAVKMQSNGLQVIIVTGQGGYIYTIATAAFSQITSDFFYASNTVAFFDGYFILDKAGTNQFYWSAILDGSSYDALDFASAEVDPDLVVAVLQDHEQLYIFGQRTIEVWYNSGDLINPFVRYTGAMAQRGCSAPLTPVKEDNTVFFLGDDLIFYRLEGYTPTRISTHATESAWTEYPRVTDAFTFSYTEFGHKFIVITFPSAPATWVIDLSTGLWHERESWGTANASYGRWRGNCTVNAYGRILMGDAYSNRIGYLDENTYTEYGFTMRGQIIAPPIQNDRKRIFVSRLEIDVESGVGLTSGQGSDPQIMIDHSDDGGRTWSILQRWASMGRIGEYQTRLRWLRGGQFRQRIYRLNITDPVKRVLIGAYVDLKIGSS